MYFARSCSYSPGTQDSFFSLGTYSSSYLENYFLLLLRSHYIKVLLLECSFRLLNPPYSQIHNCLCVCVLQLKNSLKNDVCLDQGPDNDNVPIMYLCHGMTPQVGALFSFYSHKCVSNRVAWRLPRKFEA